MQVFTIADLCSSAVHTVFDQAFEGRRHLKADLKGIRKNEVNGEKEKSDAVFQISHTGQPSK